MQKLSLEILSHVRLTPDYYRLELGGASIPEVQPGQFVQLEVPGGYLRRPISVCDADSGHIVLIYKTVGKGTHALAGLPAGASVSAVMPLGKGFSAGRPVSSALLLGGGLGAAPLHLLCRKLRDRGISVHAVLGFNTAADIVLIDEYKALGVDPVVVTLDGTAGIRGFVTDAPLPECDYFFTCGPLLMMRAVCSKLQIPGELSMEERMGCGAGFCYGCTIKTARGPARVCADGPVFDKEDILW